MADLEPQRVKFRTNFACHAGQDEVIREIQKHPEADIYTIVASRGFGKTILVNNKIVLPKKIHRPDTQVLWVAPTYKHCAAPIDDVWMGSDEKTGLRFIPQFDDATGFKFWDFRSQAMELELANRSITYYRSADNPVSIVSKGYNLIVVDEAAYIDRETFFRYILPTARRLGCKIVLISTPAGKNWFYEMYMHGQDASKTKYFSIKCPWWKRPDYPVLLREMMKDVPEHVRLQEFEAEFIGDGGAVFKNLPGVFDGLYLQFNSSQQEWRAKVSDQLKDSETFVCSVDLAKNVDFTVITVMSMTTRQVVYYCRMNKTDYKVVLDKVFRISQEFDADVIYDATGVGSGLGDFLNNKLNAHPFVFTNKSKNELVNKLAVACEYGQIKIPNITTIREEFELFTFALSRTGTLSYSAPSGKHDDCVMSIAMANWYCVENAGLTDVEAIDTFLDTVESLNKPQSALEKLVGED